MKVAMLLPSLKNVGPVRVALEIVRKLVDESGVQFTIFYVKDHVELLAPCPIRKLDLSAISDIRKHDVVHSHMLRPDMISAFLLGRKLKKMTTIHNFVKEDLYFLYGRHVAALVTPVWMLFWRKMRIAVVLSETARSYYLNLGLDDRCIQVVRNGVSLPQTLPVVDPLDVELFETLRSKGLTIVGSVCLFNDRKGLDQVVRMLEFRVDLAYVIVGDGPAKERLIDLSKSLGVDERFHILGFRHNASSYFREFDLYAMPSRAEGAPLAMLEAVASGVAVVCSDIDVFKESFDNREVTFFELENVASLAAAVDEALTNRDKRNAAHARFMCQYTSDVMAKSYLNLYKQLASEI